ncbi:hypothetical protein KKA87_10500 [bacterium]|nr:hypothetical protein [bacterium]MBU1872703.1 hypothetical protein [bacterium]
MSDSDYFFFDPIPDEKDTFKIANYASDLGYSLKITSKGSLVYSEAIKLIEENGVSDLLRMQLLQEEVLPNGVNRDKLLDTLRYKLNRIDAHKDLLIIDSYLFPNVHDSDYIDYFIAVFQGSISKCNKLSIVTKKDRNERIENEIVKRILNVNSNLTICQKYSNIFHDRYWIADQSRGLLVGTSLNGIGRKYSTIDYLDNRDTLEIIDKFNELV